MGGVLITPVAGAEGAIALLRRRGMPVVLVDSPSPTGRQCSVAVDDVLGGERAMSHLIASGHARLGYVAGLDGGQAGGRPL